MPIPLPNLQSHLNSCSIFAQSLLNLCSIFKRHDRATKADGPCAFAPDEEKTFERVVCRARFGLPSLPAVIRVKYSAFVADGPTFRAVEKLYVAQVRVNARRL